MQDKNMVINELKKLILVTKVKFVETQFDKPSVVRQPNAQRIPKPSVLGKPTPFSNSLEMRSFQTKQSVNKTNVSDGLIKQVTQQNLHSGKEPTRNTYPHMFLLNLRSNSTILVVSLTTAYEISVKKKVGQYISQVKFKKKEVEDHHRISSISKKTKSVTACNDSSNSRTSNVNAVCAECGKLPISASKPKRKANNLLQHPIEKVASDTIILEIKSYYKKLYEDTNQEWKWWIAKRCPSGYTWTQKPLRTKKIWMPKIRKDDVSSNISPTIDIVSSGDY
ncbi:hypothetical protein Tco_0523164 [Tanacetum coccineum]